MIRVLGMLKRIVTAILLLIAEMDFHVVIRAERFSIWTQRWVGIHSVHYERLLLSAAILIHVYHVLTQHIALRVVHAFLGYSKFKWLKETTKRRLPDESEVMTLNPRKLERMFVRMWMLPWVLLCLGFVCGDISNWILLWMPCEYLAEVFSACNDLPGGGKSRLRQSLENLKESFTPAPEPVPVQGRMS